MLKVAVGESPDFDALAPTALAIVMVVVVMVTVVMITTVTAIAAVVMVAAADVVRSGQRRQIVGRRHLAAGRADHSRRIMRMMMIRRVTAVVSI